MKLLLSRAREPAIGVVLCTAAALLATLGATRAWRTVVPFVFIGVIVLLAVRYGMWVAVLGSGITSLIFAYFIFPPLHSLRIEDKMERNAVAWMVLGGVVLPFLLLPNGRPRQR